MTFSKSMSSDECAPTGLNWFKLVFLSIISDFDESEIIVKLFSIVNPIEITNFWLEHSYWSEIIEKIK